MKAILALLLVVAVSAEYSNYQGRTKIEFITGLFYGIEEKGDPKVFHKCVGTMDDLQEKLWEGAQYIIKLTYADVARGIRLIAAVVAEFNSRIDTCLVGLPTLKMLVEGIRNFDGAEVIVKMVFKFVRVIQYIVVGISYLKTNDFIGLGREVGLLGKLLFMKSMAPTIVGNTTVLAFIKGFLKGIGETKAPEPLANCIHKLEDIIESLKQALMLIKAGTMSNITEGVKLLLKSIKDMMQRGKGCFDEYNQLMNLMQAMKMYNLNDVITTIMKNLMRFILDVDYAINGFVSNDYEAGASGIGDILKFVYLS